MKQQYNRLAAILAVLLAAWLLLPYTLLAGAENALVLDIPLLTPIAYTTKSESATAEETAAAQAALRSISQTAYDAFLMDHPARSMWIDVPASRISITATSHSGTGNVFHWKIKNLQNRIAIRSEYSDPAAMTELLHLVVKGFRPTGDTPYERVLSIHDYICTLTTYDTTGEYVYSAYGALIDHRAVCEGYAEAFKLLCDANGIDCVLVSGTGITSTGRENHMWNYVCMEDGNWYAVDATWDDSKQILRSYFLVGSDTVVNERNGIRFSDNHQPNGDISRTGLMTFRYPLLSPESYWVNHTPDTSSEELLPSESSSVDSTSSENPATEFPASTNESISTLTEVASVSGEAFASTIPETSDPIAESTVILVPNVTLHATASIESEGWFYRQLNEEQKNFYNHLMTLMPPGEVSSSTTTVPVVTTTAPAVLSSDRPTTEIPTTTESSPITTESNTTKDSPAITISEPETTTTAPTTARQTETTPWDTSDTLPPAISSEHDDHSLTNEWTVTLTGLPESAPISPPNLGGESGITLQYVLRVIVIVLALLALFGLIALTVIRFDRQQKS